MKNLWYSIVSIVIISSILIFMTYQLNTKNHHSTKSSITIFNWGEYIDPALLKQFEQQTGIQVIYETFDANESMLTKIEQGGTTYDIAIPSEYMIEVMQEKSLLQPLQKDLLSNIKHIDPYFLNLPFDPHNQYSIPYFWGTVGIAYNPTLLDGQTFTSWDHLWDPSLRNEILLVDSAREVMGMGLNSLHYSLNSIDHQELEAAAHKLYQLKPNVKAVIGDEGVQLMIQNEASVALTWSGQAAQMMDENDEIEYVIPEEGSNIWFDNIVIPTTASNIEGAHAFINFLLDPKVAAQNAEYVGYATPNLTALQYIEDEIVSDERFYPKETVRQRLEVYRNLGLQHLGVYNEYFLAFKMAK